MQNWWQFRIKIAADREPFNGAIWDDFSEQRQQQRLKEHQMQKKVQNEYTAWLGRKLCFIDIMN